MSISIPVTGKYFKEEEIIQNKLLLYSSLLPTKTFSLNACGTIIWEQIKKGHNLDSILSCLNQYYPYIKFSILEADMLKILKKLWLTGFISFQNSNPFQSEIVFPLSISNKVVERITFDTSKDFSFFLNIDKLLTVSDAYAPWKLINNEKKIDVEIYYSTSWFYALKDTDNNYEAGIIFKMDTDNGIINLVHLSSTSTPFITGLFIQESINRLSKQIHSKRPSTILLHLSQAVSSNYQHTLQKTGFTKICLLKNDSTKGDVDLYQLNLL